MGGFRADGTLLLIIGSSLLMGLISLAGSLTLLLTEERLKALLLPLVAFAAGAMLGGALFHLIPDGVTRSANSLWAYVWVAAGFTSFFAMDQLVNWHHQHEVSHERQPVTYMILLADSFHNFIDGIVIGGAFCIDHQLGISVCAAELGDFAVLLHGGWKPNRALLANLLSSFTFLAGGLIVYASSRIIDVSFLLPLAAGNFIYIAASDLIPEVKVRRGKKQNLWHLSTFSAGLVLLLAVRLLLEER